MSDFEPILGRYLAVDIEGEPHRVYLEEAGQGMPLLCLHTAGADSRQYRHVLNDSEITDRFRVIAFDLPYHGRSTPPDGWWLKQVPADHASYLATIRAVWRALALQRPVLLGCSMGGAIVLKAAAEFQDELTGVIGLEASRIRARPLQRISASSGDRRQRACARAIPMASIRPTARSRTARENWWIYSQSGPGHLSGRHPFLFERLGRPRRPRAHRHEAVQSQPARPANTIIPARRT